MQSLDADLRDLLIRLSIAMWDRKDAAAVAVIEDCVVGLPTGLLLRRAMPPRDDARRRLAAAVEAILSVGPPTRRTTTSKEIHVSAQLEII